MKFYGLRHIKTKKILGVSCNVSEGDCCVDVSFVFTSYYNGDIPWFVESKEKAEYARLNNTGWYNADYTSPQHFTEMKPEDYEIFEVVSIRREK